MWAIGFFVIWLILVLWKFLLVGAVLWFTREYWMAALAAGWAWAEAAWRRAQARRDHERRLRQIDRTRAATVRALVATAVMAQTAIESAPARSDRAER
jgi:hypothetical protein